MSTANPSGTLVQCITSEQRMRWFNSGLQNGTVEGGDTFDVPNEQLRST